MTRTLAAAAASIVAALALASTASATASHDAALARRGIAHAVQQSWIKPPDAQRYRAAVARAVRDTAALPKLRARVLTSQLAQLTTLWDSYTSPRALALFTQLETNTSYLETHRLPDTRVDVTDEDGVVYRWFPGLGFEFHPLASFGALNAAAAAGDAETTQLLANALVARAIPRGQRLIWEYAFGFAGGRPPWASGMAQAVAAQALARSSTVLEDPSLMTDAVRAYASVAPFVLQLPSGPWIRLYGFNSAVVLNAQLQSILSLLEYAQTTGNGNAQGLADELSAAAQALFPRFDTGDWSRYQLGGAYATREYETFVTDLLAKLAARTQDPFWVEKARVFHNYLYSPPQVTEGTPSPTIYPQPIDGFLDTAAIPVELSQRASVTLSVAGTVATWSHLRQGSHVLTWKPPAGIAPGTYPVSLSAVTYAGNRATVQLAPVVVAVDAAPSVSAAQLVGTVLTWQATDPGTPWLDLKLDLVDPTGANPPQAVELGRQPVSGSATVTLPPGSWQATTLEATNSSGLTTTFPLTPAAPSG